MLSGISTPALLRNLHAVSSWWLWLSAPLQTVQEAPSPPSSLVSIHYFMVIILTRERQNLGAALTGISLGARDVEQFFMYFGYFELLLMSILCPLSIWFINL